MLDFSVPRILAIDPNTVTGLATGVPGGSPLLWSENFKHDETDEPEDLFGRAVTFFARAFRDEPPDVVYLESPVPPSQKRGKTTFTTTLITIGMYGLIVGIVKAKGIRLRRAPINSWRKYALGSGRMKGADAKRKAVELCGRLGWKPPDHNAAESACIWMWACAKEAPHIARRPEPLFAWRLTDAYDADKDLAGSISEGFKAIRERKAAGGPGWERSDD